MNILGIHLDHPFLSISRIRKKGGAVEILWTKEENSNVKPLYISEFTGKMVGALPAKDFLIRPLDIKVANKGHLEKMIAFRTEALTHLKTEEVLIVPMDGLIFAIPRESLKNYLDEMAQLGIDPHVVSTVPTALYYFVRWKFPTLSNVFVIDLGSHNITCVHVEEGKFKKAHGIGFGVENLLEALYTDRKRILLKKEIEGAAKQIDLLLLKSGLNPKLSENLFALKQELEKIFFSFTRGAPATILFTGRTDAFIHLSEFLMGPQVGYPIPLEEQKGAVSIGLCLEQARGNPLQLRKEEFFPKQNWIQMGRIALSLLAGSLFLSLFSLCMGLWMMNQTKAPMLSHTKGLSVEEWMEQIENNNQEYPYIIQTKTVSEILSWLASHRLQQEDDPMNMREIRIQLVNFPKIENENDPYLVQIDLEFAFKNPINARKFHEKLRLSEDWVDTSQEITWENLDDGYRTTFYLHPGGAHV